MEFVQKTALLEQCDKCDCDELFCDEANLKRAIDSHLNVI